MRERDLAILARGVRSSGSVRFTPYSLEPKSPANTSPSDIANVILDSVFRGNPEKFILEERPQAGEIRFHWNGITDLDKRSILELCVDRIGENTVAEEYDYGDHIFDLIYQYLNTQVT